MIDYSFGIIPLRKSKAHLEVLLIKHGKKHWSFPKGHSELNETPEETAIRELKEETGLSIKKLLPLPPVQEHYFFTWEGKKIEKFVTYFLASVEGKVKLQESEIEDYQWLTFEDAIQRATFPESKRVCQALLDITNALIQLF